MKAQRVKKLDPAAPLNQNVARLVRVRVGELRSFAPEALEFGATRDQHDMRIAAKRLRYILEATGFCLGSIGDRGRKRARELQGVLGELHDCDVMLPRVENRLEEMRQEDATDVRQRAGDAPDLDPRLLRSAPHRTSYRGLEVLAVYLKARRELLYDRFVELWERQERLGTWTALDGAAERQLRLERERREAGKRADQARARAEAAMAAEREAREAAERLEQSLREARE
jgi:hypothetical protein